MPYIGNTAANRFVASKAATQFSGDGSETQFTLDHSVSSDEDILVSVDGVIQEPSVAYSVSGTTLTFTAAPSNNPGNNIFVYYLFRTVGTVSHPSTNSLEATSGTFTGAFTSLGIDDNADSNALTITNDEKVGIGTTTPNRRLVVGGQAEMSIQNNDMSANRRNFNFFLTGDKGHMRLLNDAGTAGGTSVSIDNDGIMDGACFTGDYGTCFGMLDSSTIGDSNIPHNSYGTPNSTFYRWVLPKAGTYLLSSNMRIRMWGVFGFIKARLYNNTTSTAIEGGNLTGTTLGSQAHIRMLLENSSANNPEYLNVNITANYMITTTADNQDIHHQLNSTDNSTNTSLQSDSNGRNIHWWQRIG